jgi:SAM-dependent methyltransferase
MRPMMTEPTNLPDFGLRGVHPDWARAQEGVDIAGSAPARVYDGLLGGSCNFGVDRDVADDLVARQPEARYWAQANRRFLHRALRFALDRGVRQILDIGCGLPETVGSVHETVWQIAPDTRVAYVDIDPLVVASAEHLAEQCPGLVAVSGDARDPDAIVGHPQVARHLDFGQPVLILLVAVLHFVDHTNPATILNRLRDAVVGGSLLAVSHASIPQDMTPEAIGAARAYSERTAPLTLRTPEQGQALLAGWELVEPGVVGVEFWRPELDDLDDPQQWERANRVPGWVGVAIKP